MGVFPAELDDPLHVDDVQIAGEHEGFPLHHAGLFILGPNARADRSEAEILRVLLCRVHLVNLVHTKRDLEIDTWHGRVRIPAEPENDPSVASWDPIHGGKDQDDQKNNHDHKEPEGFASLLQTQ